MCGDKSNRRNSYFIWKGAWFHYIALAGPELAVRTRLVSNLHRFTSFFLPTAGNDIEHHCDRFAFLKNLNLVILGAN